MMLTAETEGHKLRCYSRWNHPNLQ